MMLERSERDLALLLAYLLTKTDLPREVGSIRLEWSQDNDNLNKQNPRLFCSTEPGSRVISCSRALEDVDRQVRVGVLIHEIGHIVLGAFENTDAEVDVDAWVAELLPKGSYMYLNSHDYMNSLVGERVEARAVECVSGSFLKLMDKASHG